MIIDLQTAARLIQNGEPVAVPTETVYGLAADAFSLTAIRKTFELKGRPEDNPLIVHISDIEMIHDVATEIPKDALRLAGEFWPGPLSLILKKRIELPDIATGGLSSVAVRMPNQPETLELIRRTGPLTAPSANRSGKPSPTRISHILDDYGSDLPVLEGAEPEIGIESTVLDLTSSPYAVLRPGIISAMELESFLGKRVLSGAEQPVSARQKRSPGTRYTHYKPDAEVMWIDTLPEDPDLQNHYFILHSVLKLDADTPTVHNYRGDFNSMAKDLYDHFREADRLSCSIVKVERIPEYQDHPLIPALRNRIDKASGI
jgi:L-threonylcarbamoyladenylate synthase